MKKRETGHTTRQPTLRIRRSGAENFLAWRTFGATTTLFEGIGCLKRHSPTAFYNMTGEVDLQPPPFSGPLGPLVLPHWLQNSPFPLHPCISIDDEILHLRP